MGERLAEVEAELDKAGVPAELRPAAPTPAVAPVPTDGAPAEGAPQEGAATEGAATEAASDGAPADGAAPAEHHADPDAPAGGAAEAGAPPLSDEAKTLLATRAHLQRFAVRVNELKAKTASDEPQKFRTDITPRETEHGYMVGVRFTFAIDGEATQQAGVGEIALASIVTCWTQSVATLRAIGRRVFQGDKSVKFSGPLNIGRQLTKAVEKGWRDFVWLLALLSVALGLLNLLPVPALDGIKILTLMIESLFRRDINHALQVWVNGLGLLALMGLILVMTILEVGE